MISTAVDADIRKIWFEVFGQTPAERTFFDLGGDSITALRLASRIEQQAGVDIDIADIFDLDPTVGELVNLALRQAS